MLINGPILTISSFFTLLAMNAVATSSLQEAGVTVLLYSISILVINKLFNLLSKEKSANEKLNELLSLSRKEEERNTQFFNVLNSIEIPDNEHTCIVLRELKKKGILSK